MTICEGSSAGVKAKLFLMAAAGLIAMGQFWPANAQDTTGHTAPPQPGQLANPAGQAADRNGVMQLPNTVSAPPFTVGDKFAYRVVQTFGLRGLLGAFVSASIGQGAGSPYEWGGGVEGYAKRYVSGFGGNVSRQTMAFAIESVMHEDPRYFPSEGQPLRHAC